MQKVVGVKPLSDVQVRSHSDDLLSLSSLLQQDQTVVHLPHHISDIYKTQAVQYKAVVSGTKQLVEVGNFVRIQRDQSQADQVNNLQVHVNITFNIILHCFLFYADGVWDIERLYFSDGR